MLEEAARQALDQPVKRTPAHRLALAWLTLMDFAPTAEADAFWRILGHAGPYGGKDSEIRRSADGGMYLRRWKRRAGV